MACQPKCDIGPSVSRTTRPNLDRRFQFLENLNLKIHTIYFEMHRTFIGFYSEHLLLLL